MNRRLNLASQPFRSHRAINLVLGMILVASIGFSLWQVRGYAGYRAESPDLRALEEARSRWDQAGRRIEELNQNLSRPEAQAQLRELQYLSQVVERKRFSWTRVMQVVEEVIPREVYLVGLQPEISETGDVYIQMEARGQSIADVSRFVAALENTAAFSDVTVSVEERGTVEGRSEVRIVMGASYSQDRDASRGGGQTETP